jgi:hypothetical protein
MTCEYQYTVSARLKLRTLLCERSTLQAGVSTTTYGRIVSHDEGRMAMNEIVQVLIAREPAQLSHFLA